MCFINKVNLTWQDKKRCSLRLACKVFVKKEAGTWINLPATNTNLKFPFTVDGTIKIRECVSTPHLHRRCLFVFSGFAPCRDWCIYRLSSCSVQLEWISTGPYLSGPNRASFCIRKGVLCINHYQDTLFTSPHIFNEKFLRVFPKIRLHMYSWSKWKLYYSDKRHAKKSCSMFLRSLGRFRFKQQIPAPISDAETSLPVQRQITRNFLLLSVP